MADLFNIGLSGLRAAQTNLSVTGQNITNVNTPGYSRQTAVQTTIPASFTGAGYMGNGTKVVDIQRIYNQFLTNQVRATTSATAANPAYNVQIEELKNTLSMGLCTGSGSAGKALSIDPDGCKPMARRLIRTPRVERLAPWRRPPLRDRAMTRRGR